MRRVLTSSLLLALAASFANAQTTAFTYQGELKDSGQPANGSYDLTIAVWDASTAGNQINRRCFNDQPVVNGRFAVEMDFGPLVQSNPFFVEVSARRHTAGVNCSNSSGFTTLTPRQKITAAPAANYAMTASSLSAPDGSPSRVVSMTNDGRLDIAGPQEAMRITSTDPIVTLTDSNSGRRVQLQNASGRFFVTGENFLNGSNLGAFTMVDRNGKLAIGTFNPQGTLDVRAGNSSYFIVGSDEADVKFNGGVDGHMGFFNEGPATGGTYFLGQGIHRLSIMNDGRIGIGTITPTTTLDVVGDIQCVNLIQTSSAAFKDEITPLSAGLEELMKLEPVSYVWNDKAPEQARGTHDLGFIAEDVAKILPDAVGRDASGKVVGIDYSRITVLAVKAIKDQQARHEADQAKIQSLLERLEKLEAALPAAR